MASVGMLRAIGTIAHIIGIALSSLLIYFAFYVAKGTRGLLGIVGLDSYLGATGIVFGLAGIYGVISMDLDMLSLNKAYVIVASFFSIGAIVIHTVIPFYHNFEDDSYAISNAFYIAASGFILTLIQSLYSFYISFKVHKFRKTQLEDEDDLESNVSSKLSFDLNETSRSLKTTV